MCTVTLTLEIWLYIKVNANPLVTDNNGVKYVLCLTMGLEVKARTFVIRLKYLLTETQTPDRPDKQQLGRRHWDLASCQVQRFQRRSRKCLTHQRLGRLVFRSAKKNLVENVEIFLSTRQRKAWHPLAGGQSWPWPMTPRLKINRVSLLIIHNLYVKFESDWA